MAENTIKGNESITHAPQIINCKEVAEILHCSLPTAREFLHRKGVPSFKVGREIRIEKNALINYVQNARGVDYEG